MKLSDAIKRTIELSTRIRDYYDIEVPKHFANYPLVGPGEQEQPPPPEEGELEAFLASLPKDELLRLMLVAHVGSAEASADRLAEKYEEWKVAERDPEQLSYRRMHPASLGDWLLDGLDVLAKRRIDVDRLPVKKRAIRKG